MTGAAVSRQIAGYRLDELAGRGGMGVVYRATDLRLERTVALKVIAPALASDPVFRERFQREARLLAAIDHPHVIPFFEADEADGQLFLSMRWVDGCDLADVIHSSGGVEPTRALSIARQIAGALDAVHARGLVHRDLKPGNVLLENSDGEEHAYLTDFGAGRALDGPSEVTGTGQWLGSVDYIAPETLSGCRASARSDIYALGCVLFEALTGTPPFHRDTQLATLWAHQRDPPPSVCARRPALPTQLDAVLARALAKDPELRYPTAARLADALGDALLVTRGADTVTPRPDRPGSEAQVAVVPDDLDQTPPGPSTATSPVAARRRRSLAQLGRLSILRNFRLPVFRRLLIGAPVLAAAAVLIVSQLAAAPPARTSGALHATGAIASIDTYRRSVSTANQAAGRTQVTHRQRTQPHGDRRSGASHGTRSRTTHAARTSTRRHAAATSRARSSSASTGPTYTAAPVTTPVTSSTPSKSLAPSSGTSAGAVAGPSGSAPFGPGYPGG